MLAVAIASIPSRADVLPNPLKLNVAYRREYHPAYKLLGHNILQLDSFDSKVNH